VRHLEVRERVARLFSLFADDRGLGRVFGEKALCVFPRNDYEPDVCYFGPEKAARLRPDQLKLPIPDFVAEVLSESTEARDRGEKFEDYQAHGVREYWILDPDREILEQYMAEGGVYRLVQKSATGEVRSAVMEGFCIPIRALFDAQSNLAAVRELLKHGAG
jgi:Uma2 family endonuclease